MTYRDLIGHWEITANSFPGSLDVWQNGNAWRGRLWFNDVQRWESLANVAFNNLTSVLQFPRSNQDYTGTLQADELIGAFTQHGVAQVYHWNATRAWSPLSALGTSSPRVRFVATRAAARMQGRCLSWLRSVFMEDRLRLPRVDRTHCSVSSTTCGRRDGKASPTPTTSVVWRPESGATGACLRKCCLSIGSSEVSTTRPAGVSPVLSWWGTFRQPGHVRSRIVRRRTVLPSSTGWITSVSTQCWLTHSDTDLRRTCARFCHLAGGEL